MVSSFDETLAYTLTDTDDYWEHDVDKSCKNLKR